MKRTIFVNVNSNIAIFATKLINSLTIRRSIDSVYTIQSQILAFATLPIFNQLTGQVLVARHINTGIRSEEIGWF